jgi:hypothetical protein
MQVNTTDGLKKSGIKLNASNTYTKVVTKQQADSSRNQNSGTTNNKI